jgi:hypothetical protein
MPGSQDSRAAHFPRTNVYKNPLGIERGSAEKRFATNQRAGELCAKLADNEHVFSST